MTRDILSRLADIVLSEIPSDRSLFLVLDERGRSVFEKAGGMEDDNGGGRALKEAVIRGAFERGRPVLIPDPAGGGDLTLPDGDDDVSPRSVLCFPWTRGGRPAGCVYLAREADGAAYTRDNLEFLILALSPAIYLMNKEASRTAGDGQAAGPPEPGVSPFLGRTASIRRVREMIEKVRESDAPVFIWGESGTGKELAARTIHDTGARKKGQFVAVNCGAIPENLLESELFGHARGAFTGALRDKAGLVEEAHGGTFFLDEIGDLPLVLQGKLLRVLEEKRIRRVGENRSRAVDVRFISATNKDIEGEVARRNFREDLLYRLKIIAVELPPLRSRPEDIPLLVNHFLDEFARSAGRVRPFFSPLALELLATYSWPGNVRELQNEIQRCLVISGWSSPIPEDALSPKINPRREVYSEASRRFLEAKAEFEKRFIREALERSGYHRTRTAAAIGLTRQGLFKLMKKHGIDGSDTPPPAEREGQTYTTAKSGEV